MDGSPEKLVRDVDVGDVFLGGWGGSFVPQWAMMVSAKPHLVYLVLC